MNIQAVARRTGVPAATLRKWEQRYGVLRPERTTGAHRRYAEHDIMRVEWLKARLAEGYRIGEAARLLGAAETEAPLDADALVDELVAAAGATDDRRIHRALEQAFTLYEPQEAIAKVVEPALRAVGDRWASGDLGVGQEHHASEIFRGHLRHLLDSTRAGPLGTAVLACVAGERHELGLLSLAVLMQADGWRIVYLGADTPIHEAADVAAALEAAVLCVSATMPEPAAAAGPDLDEVTGANSMRVVRGGAAFHGDSAVKALAALRRTARP